MVCVDTVISFSIFILTRLIDRKVRDKALESLTLFLRARDDLSLLDLLKLWKGLFFCMSRDCDKSSRPFEA